MLMRFIIYAAAIDKMLMPRKMRHYAAAPRDVDMRAIHYFMLIIDAALMMLMRHAAAPARCC